MLPLPMKEHIFVSSMVLFYPRIKYHGNRCKGIELKHVLMVSIVTFLMRGCIGMQGPWNYIGCTDEAGQWRPAQARHQEA